MLRVVLPCGAVVMLGVGWAFISCLPCRFLEDADDVVALTHLRGVCRGSVSEWPFNVLFVAQNADKEAQ